jgi:uncharacterized OsmC-like protein
MPKSKLRPPARLRRIRPPDPFDLMDEAVASCRAIEVLAQLLDMAGAADTIEGALAAETGWMIGRHAKKLHQTLNTLKERP